jgi:hypothetical protein
MIKARSDFNEFKESNPSIKDHQELELIKGEFSAEDARDILLQLFTDKINYHQARNLSSLERFGKLNDISVRRLPELKFQIQKINDLFKNADLSGATIKIQATVNIEITE